MVGTRLAHYQVLERLGAGGMGEVFRARDERLQREVALKLLPQRALADPARRLQFVNEAVAASRVNHPNIGVVYELGSDGPADFIVMELVPGESLELRLGRGSLSEEEAVSLGSQIADALAALHAQGLAHLDLKPSNIVVTPEGRAKLVDFGLSRWLGAVADSMAPTVAASGSRGFAGTLAYSAPERFHGAEPDPRSDLWSLGVMLYRATTGRMPFEGDDVAALTYSVLEREWTEPRALNPALTPGIEAVLRRALARPLEQRFASAAEMAAALRGRTGGAIEMPPARIRALAVLPLANLSGDPAQEFFVDGMTDALIADLACLEDVRVISRTSAMRYKGTTMSLPEIGRELGIQAVVEGSVQRSGSRVRVSARLIETPGDRSLWASSVERDVEDVFALQSEVAKAVADGVRARIAPSRKPGEVPTEAYELYLRGRHHWNRRTVADVRLAKQFFEDAIARAPRFALAHAGLADAFNVLADLAALTPEIARTSARAAAERALALDPRLPEAHTSQGFVRFFHEWDWEGAETSFRQALASGHGWATAHQWYAELLSALKRFDEGEAHARRALEVDPLAFVLHTTLADVFYFSRRYEDAIAVLRGTLELEPDHGPSRMDLGRVLSQVGRHDEAIAEFERAVKLMPGGGRATSGLAYALAHAGRCDEARAMLPELVAQVPSGNVTSHAIAVLQLEMSDRNAALDWLERGVAEHDRGMVWLSVHPRLDPLRDEPRFRKLLETMRLPG